MGFPAEEEEKKRKLTGVMAGVDVCEKKGGKITRKRSRNERTAYDVAPPRDSHVELSIHEAEEVRGSEN